MLIGYPLGDSTDIYQRLNSFTYEIDIIYKTKEKGIHKIFGEEFVENNNKNIELIINDKKSKFIDEYEKDPERGEQIMRHMFTEPWCKMIRRNLIVNYSMLFDDTSIHEDVKFSCLIGIYANISSNASVAFS